MRRFICFSLTALVITLAWTHWTLPTPVPATNEDEWLQWLDETIPHLMQQYAVPHVSLAVITDTTAITTRTYTLDENALIPPDTSFQIASVSKPLAAWGVMTLVEQGLVDLDTPLQTYLGAWQLPLGDFDSDAVTVRRALAHTSGLSVSGYAGFLPEQQLQSLTALLDAAQSAENPDDASVRVVTEPGSNWLYSGGGYSVLQLLVETVSEQPFADYMQQAIFEPLGMTNTGYTQPDNLLAVYNVAGQTAPTRRFTALAAGGAYSTGADLALWVAAGLQPGRLLNVTTLEAMYTAEVNLGWGQGFGLGYHVDKTVLDQHTVIWHDGNNVPGWRSWVSLSPETNSGLVLLSNSPGGKPLREAIACGWMGFTLGDSTIFCLLQRIEARWPWLASGLLIVTIGTALLGRRSRN